MNFKKYFKELNRRHVVKVGIAYLVVAWLLIQVLSILIPAFELPTYLLKTSIIILTIGFPIWLIFSWVYDLTPEGFKKTENVAYDDEVSAKKNVKLNRIIIGTLSIAVILLVVNQVRMHQSNADEIAELTKIDNRKSIAVLPFSNLSPNNENAFFSDGMHEDVLNKLGSLKDLKVISRTSVLAYRDYEGDLKAVGDKLGVRYIVEGTVSRWENEVKVTVNLIDATTNKGMWSNSYNGELKNVFKLQSDIAQEIVDALNTKITQEELAHIDEPLTDNIEVYDNYVKARNITNKSWYNLKQLMQAIDYLKAAVKVDKNFVAGWSLLSILQSDHYSRLNEAKDEEEAAQAKKDAEFALNRTKELQPTGFYFYRADGYFQHIVNDDPIKALSSFDKAMEIYPNDAETLGYQARLYLGLGQLDKMTENLEKAYTIDNQNQGVAYFLTMAYEATHRYKVMVPVLKRLVVLDPSNNSYKLQEKYYQFLAEGSLEAYNSFKNTVKHSDLEIKFDSRGIVNYDMVVAMFDDDYDSYIGAWKGEWTKHHANHGNWSCPLQLNDETNQANLLIKHGKKDLAFKIIERTKSTAQMPYNKNAFCIFNSATYEPKLDYMLGDKTLARKEFEDIIPQVMNNEAFPRGPVERMVLLETADLVAPDQVYSIYKQVTSKPVSFASLETICANPWIYPNLIKDPNFIEDIRKDGRFVAFLEHYKLIPQKTTS